MDVPQEMAPAALYGAVVMVVGGVEVADQDAGAGVAQRLVHHGLAPVPSQEVALAGRAESDWSKIAHVAVVAVLTPARFVGVDHRTGADLGQDFGHCGLGLLGGAMHRVHDGPRAEV